MGLAATSSMRRAAATTWLTAATCRWTSTAHSGLWVRSWLFHALRLLLWSGLFYPLLLGPGLRLRSRLFHALLLRACLLLRPRLFHTLLLWPGLRLGMLLRHIGRSVGHGTPVCGACFSMMCCCRIGPYSPSVWCGRMFINSVHCGGSRPAMICGKMLCRVL